MPSTLRGADVSNLQGPPANYRGSNWYHRAEFIICQAIPRPRPNGICAEQLHAAHDDGKHTGVYSWLWHDPNWRLTADVRQDQLLRLATVGDAPVDMRPWLDAEDNQSSGWRNVSVAQRRDEVLVALATLTEWAVGRLLPQAGLYTSTYFVNLLYGGNLDWLPPGTPTWLAHYGVPAGSLIGGMCVAHQFSSSPIDQDVLLESEIVTQGAPIVHIPADYVTKFSLADDQDVQGLIDNFEGICRDLQGQIDTDAAGDATTVTTDAALQTKLDQIRAIVAA